MPRPKLIGRGFGRFVAPECQDIWHQHIISVVKHQEKRTCDVILKCIDDSSSYVLLNSIKMNSPTELQGKSAEDPGVLMAVVDITDLRRAEEELRIKDWSIQTMTTGIAFATPDGNLTFANNSWLRMWGYSELDEAAGLHISEFVSDRDLFWNLFKTFLEEGSVSDEFKAQRKDGSTFYVLFSGNTVRDDSGKPVCIMASFVDITERKAAEEALKRHKEELERRVEERTAELKESRNRFQDLVENTPDWVWEIDEKGVYNYVSPKVWDILGYEPQEVLNRTPFDLMDPERGESGFRYIRCSHRLSKTSHGSGEYKHT